MEYRYLPEKLTNKHIAINELQDNEINITIVYNIWETNFHRQS